MKSLLTVTLAAAVISAALVEPAEAQTPPSCYGARGYSTSQGGLRTFLWRPDRLALAHERVARDPSDPALVALLADADRAMRRGPYSVVDKTRPAESGDKHDYISIGPYWWPDESKADGLPYVRRDGRRNPEYLGDAFDRRRLGDFSTDVSALALAYRLTGRQAYADKAAALIRVWFLDPATRMNPNLNHGQAVPGRVAGRAEGVIDLVSLAPVVESIGLIESADVLTDAERAGLRAWFSAMIDWLTNSSIGREEAAADNNHGIFYDALTAHFALFADREDVARRLVRAAPTRWASQIEPDGRMPHELTRTQSLHYATWTVVGLMDMADLASCVNEDLWRWSSPDGRSLRGAVDFVAAYAGREGEWPYPELKAGSAASLPEVTARAAWAFSDPDLAAKADAYRQKDGAARLNLLTPPDAR